MRIDDFIANFLNGRPGRCGSVSARLLTEDAPGHIALYSYEEPIAVLIGPHLYVRSDRVTMTTDRHIRRVRQIAAEGGTWDWGLWDPEAMVRSPRTYRVTCPVPGIDGRTREQIRSLAGEDPKRAQRVKREGRSTVRNVCTPNGRAGTKVWMGDSA